MPIRELIQMFVLPLHRADIPYIVTGSLASMFFGELRLTTDVDIVIDVSARDVDKLEALFPAPEYYCPPPDVIRMEVRRPIRGHLNINHPKTGHKADLYIAGDDPLHAWAFKKRVLIQMDGESVYLAPPEFVILRKMQYHLEGGSEKHIRDIRNMLAKSGEDINTDEIKRRAQSLGLTRIWKKVAPAQ